MPVKDPSVFVDATIDDVLADPAKFGAPSFDDFKKNREKYKGRDDDQLASADKGSTALNRHVRKHYYELNGHRTTKIEELERIARNEGYTLKELVFKPELIPLGEGEKCDIVIRFESKVRRMLSE